jgi:hypothetical protein
LWELSSLNDSKPNGPWLLALKQYGNLQLQIDDSNGLLFRRTTLLQIYL